MNSCFILVGIFLDRYVLPCLKRGISCMRWPWLIGIIFFCLGFIVSADPLYAEVVVPLERVGEHFVVEARVNGVPIKFTIDTGASTVSLSKYSMGLLIFAGAVDRSDVGGETLMQLSDGSTEKFRLFNIRELVLGEIVLENVEAAVVQEGTGSDLLGQNVLNRLGIWSIDTYNDRLIISSRNLVPAKDPVRWLKGYYDLLSADRFREAYLLRSRRSRRETSYEYFYEVWKNNESIYVDTASVVSLSSYRAVLYQRLVSQDVTPSGDKVTQDAYWGKVKLVWEDGDWRYDGFDIFNHRCLYVWDLGGRRTNYFDGYPFVVRPGMTLDRVPLEDWYRHRFKGRKVEESHPWPRTRFSPGLDSYRVR